jgi:hypothetical protein
MNRYPEEGNQDAYYNDGGDTIQQNKINIHSYFVSSPTNLLETLQAQAGQKEQPLEALFDFMDPNAKGIDRLLKEDDKVMLLSIKNKINEELKDLTSQENDTKNGYIAKKNAVYVPA